MSRKKQMRAFLVGAVMAAAALLIPASHTEAAAKPAKIASAKVKDGQVVVKAKVKKPVSSSDGNYYLVKLNGINNQPACTLAELPKDNSLTFKLDTGDKVNVISKFGIAVKKGKKLKLISNTKYVANPEAVATNDMEYTLPSTKKGIQTGSDRNLNIKHTLISMNLNELITTKGAGEPYVYNGKTYYFSNRNQATVAGFNQDGICVSMSVYLNWSDTNKYLIYPTGREKGGYWYAWNTVDETARETLEAAFCYLGEKFSQPDCYVSNWVVGNEVNSQQQWNHVGKKLSLAKYTKAYVQAFKMFSDAIHTGWSNARVFVPLDNAWNIPVSEMGWTGKTFLTSFAKEMKKECPKTAWNLAYHAYSFPLTGAPYAKNQYVTKSANSYYITPQNLKYLTSYIKKKYGSKTRIILSEQGYMASMGEKAQAASILYAYYMAEFDPMVDAYIIRAEKDYAPEVAEGYNMGLTTYSGKRREAYNLFKYMDSRQSKKYAKKYLKVIGARKWKSIIPGYKESKFKTFE